MNAVAKKSDNAIASTNSLFDEIESEGFGFDSSDLVTPRIVLVGDLSPQRKKNSAKYIEGVDVGDIVDASTGEILAKFGEKFPFLPVYRTKEAIRWRPNQGGMETRTSLEAGRTFRDFAQAEGLEQNKDYVYLYDNGDELIEHWNYFGLDLSRGGMPCFLSMKKTNIKVGKRWNTMMENAKLPSGKKSPRLFTHVYEIGAFTDSGNNREWPNWTVTQLGYIEEVFTNGEAADYIERASSLYDIVKAGAYKAEVDDDGDNLKDGVIPF